MQQHIYTLKYGDSLITIAENLGISVELIKIHHNRYCDLEELIGGDSLPRGLKRLILPSDLDKIRIEYSSVRQKDSPEKIEFHSKEKYRCEQINVTKIDGIPLSNSLQKMQFSVLLNTNRKLAKISLDDFYHDMSPPILNKAFDFLSHTEKIRNNTLLQYRSDNGKIDLILNKEQQQKEWDKFKNSPDFNNEFIRRLKQTHQKSFHDIVNMGNKQFSPDYDSEKEYRRSHFHMIFFDRHLTAETIEPWKENFKYLSILMPETLIDMKFRTDIINETEDLYHLRKVGTATITPELEEDIINKYNQYHKPQIKYSFTNYKLEYRQQYEVDKNTKMILGAKSIWIEAVEDNIENYCEFKVRKL